MSNIEPSKLSRKGLQKFTNNPFLPTTANNTKTGTKRITNRDGQRMMVVSESTGEIIGGAGFWHTQMVDKTAFIKLFINGVKAFKELTGAGTKVFHILYLEMQKEIGKDVVYLNFLGIDQNLFSMSKVTWHKGLKELLEKGFIAETMIQNKYFINPDYVFNGDRLALVQEYRLIGSKSKDDRTIDLFTEDASALPPPEKQ
jgi:hypothetical protein